MTGGGGSYSLPSPPKSATGRHAKEDNEGLFSNSKNMDTLCLGFLYFGNSLRSIKTNLGWFFKPNKESFRDGFLACVLLGCFQHFRWIPIMNHYRGS